MGQDTTEKLINQLKFTTLNELRELIDEKEMGTQSIIKSLGRLSKYNEVITFKISRETIYLSPKFYNKIGKTK